MLQTTPLHVLRESLFWLAPLELDKEFSAGDPLAIDYLSQQVANWLFPCFTTRTDRAQYYAVVLYGLQLVESIAVRDSAFLDARRRAELFERWERLWALAVLASHKEPVVPGHRDAMRGLLGAKKEWERGDPRSLNFSLLSRQSELGALGAYLTSLRKLGLVGDRAPTTAGAAIAKGLWARPGSAAAQELDAFVRTQILGDGTLDPRDHDKLRKIGKQSRLTALHNRSDQRARLRTALFEVDPAVHQLARCIVAAAMHGVKNTEAVLQGLRDETWGKPPPTSRVRSALQFGRLAQQLLAGFNRCYAATLAGDGDTGVEAAAVIAFGSEFSLLRTRCAEAREHLADLDKLEFHGPPFLTLLRNIAQAPDESVALRCLLRFHDDVQATRHRHSLISETHGRLMVAGAVYNGHETEAAFPTLRIPTVRRLLLEVEGSA